MPFDTIVEGLLTGLFELCFSRPQGSFAAATVAAALCAHAIVGAPAGWLGGVSLAVLAAIFGWWMGALADAKLGPHSWLRLALAVCALILALALAIAAVAFAVN